MIDEIKLTKDLIKINSTNPGKFEKDVFNFVEALLNKKKIKYKKYLLNKNRPNLVIGFAAATGGFFTVIIRFLFPNVLFEPPQSFKIGFPEEFAPNTVDTRFKKEFNAWIVRDDESLFALSTVCTHLGGTPNWHATDNKYQCPCHGSGFRMTGIHFEGPAPRPLERFKIGIADDGQVLVDKTKSFKWEKGEWENRDSFLKV